MVVKGNTESAPAGTQITNSRNRKTTSSSSQQLTESSVWKKVLSKFTTQSLQKQQVDWSGLLSFCPSFASFYSFASFSSYQQTPQNAQSVS